MLIRLIFVFFSLSIPTSFANAQTVFQQEKGLLKTYATISPGFLLKQKLTNIYLHGNLEYFAAENVSLRGDSYIFVGQQQGSGLDFFHSTFAGISYHFLDEKVDPFLALQPGVGFIQIDENSGVEISPLFSIEAGVNYYVHRFMHFFFAVRYVGGASFSGAESPYSLNEIRISAGLGFNFLAKRKKS